MKYAVIKIKGKQYKVKEGDEILIGKLEKEEKPQTDVLLMVDGQDVKIGKPLLQDVNVKLKILKQEEKGKKLHVYKFKAKSRYRKKQGFRQVNTRVLVENIS